MRFLRFLLPLFLASHIYAQSSWRDSVAQAIPLFGRHNWIVLADPAFPYFNSAGIDVAATGLSQTDLLNTVLDSLSQSHRIRPAFYTDAELPFVAEKDALGISAYRAQINSILKGADVTPMPEADILRKLDPNYRIIVLKSTTQLPYTAIFIELKSGYWSDDAEKRLRAAMEAK
jgi:hypothetical protein